MAKSKIVFFCQECGFESAKWMGQCPACKAWNTFVEEPTVPKNSRGAKASTLDRVFAVPTRLSQVSLQSQPRTLTGIGELDRVLGGGIVKGSLVLVGGDPGIGKSTLLLQMCRLLAQKSVPLLYISGEESLQQIKMRAQRLGDFEKDMMMLCETDLDIVEGVVRKYKPEIVIIDSIQTMYRQEIASRSWKRKPGPGKHRGFNAACQRS